MKTLKDWLASQPYLENRAKLYHQAALLEGIRDSLEIAQLWRMVNNAVRTRSDAECALVHEQTAARLGYGLGVTIGQMRSIPNPNPKPEPTDKRLFYRAEIVLTRGRSITVPDIIAWTNPVPQTGNDSVDILFHGYTLHVAIEAVIREAFNQVCVDLVTNAFDCDVFNQAEVLKLVFNDKNGEGIEIGEVTPSKITRFLESLASHYTAVRQIFTA